MKYNHLPFNPYRLDNEWEYKCYLLWEKHGRDINLMNKAMLEFLDEKAKKKQN